MNEPKRYTSIYSQKKILPQQYIAELACRNRAESLKIELPPKFLSTAPQWKAYYFYQIKLAKQLLEEFDAKSIIACLQQSHKVFSLNSPFIRQDIKKIIKHQELQKNITTKKYDRPSNPTFRHNQNTSNLSELF